MKTVGHRREKPLSFWASAELLKEGARFNETLQHLPTGRTTFFPKGVYRYRTFEEANRHWLECVARGMAEFASRRR
jgi:hypothetical protein